MSESNAPVPQLPAAAQFVPSAVGPSPSGSKTIGSILDRTFQLTRGHFKLLVGTAAIPSAILLVVVLLMEGAFWFPMIRQWPKQPPPEIVFHYFAPAFMIPVIVAMSLVNLAIFSIYMAAASFASTQADLGVKITIGEAYRLAWWRGSRYLWLLTLCYLYAFLPLLLIELSFFAVASLFIHSGAGVDSALFLLIPLAVLLVVAAMVYGVLMALRLSLAFPACVQENLTAYAAIKRSFQLTRGAKGRIFLVILVIYALLYAGILVVEIAAAFLAAIGVFAAMALHVHLSPPWSYIGLGLLAVCGLAALILFVSLTYAAMMTGLAVIYNDQRLRKDGLPPAPLPAGAAV